MMELIAHNLAPIMFVGLFIFLLIGFPVAFSLGACGLVFATIGIEMGVLPESLMQALPLRLFGIMQGVRGARHGQDAATWDGRGNGKGDSHRRIRSCSVMQLSSKAEAAGRRIGGRTCLVTWMPQQVVASGEARPAPAVRYRGPSSSGGARWPIQVDSERRATCAKNTRGVIA